MPIQQFISPNLIFHGPTIELLILPPKSVVEALHKQGKKIPQKKVLALIDTGATCTCIDSSVAKELELVSFDAKKVQTAGGEDLQAAYDVSVVLPLAKHMGIQVQVLEAKLTNQPYSALLGRDILRECTLIYNGWNNSYQLHL